METIQITQKRARTATLNRDSVIPKKKVTEYTEVEMMELSLRDYLAGRYRVIK